MTDTRAAFAGAAWALRPTRTVVWQQRISATRTMRVERTIYADATLVDRLHYRGQLSDRQHNAANRLYQIWWAAALCPHVSARFETARDEAEDGSEDVAGGMDRDDARTAYRRILRDAGQVAGPVLDAMMHDQHPGVRYLEVAQMALERLADGWGMERA